MKSSWIFLLMFISVSKLCWAIPIATNVALPVAKGEFVYRIQAKSRQLKGESETYTLPVAAAYGLSGKTVLITSIPYKTTPSASGVADVVINIRHTIYQKDAPQKTSRFAILGGIKLPVGSDSFTTDSTDWRFGGVYTYQYDRHEFDASIVYSINTKAKDLELGDTISHDFAYQYRISPSEFASSGIPSQINLDFEINGIYTAKSEVSNVKDSNSGSYKLFLSSGLQWVNKNLIVEGLAQFPVIQNLNGMQTKEEMRLILGFRFQM